MSLTPENWDLSPEHRPTGRIGGAEADAKPVPEFEATAMRLTKIKALRLRKFPLPELPPNPA
jgi:hypothetical protein